MWARQQILKLKYLEAVLDNEPLLSEHLLALAEWISGYYLAPLGEVLRGMLPLMAEVRRTVYYRITDRGRDVLASSADGDSGSMRGRSSRMRSTKRTGEPAFRSREVVGEEHGMEQRVLERLASGEPVKVSTLRTATAASLQLLTRMVRKKWIARETAAAERDARRTERFAVLIPDARLPVLTRLQQAILAELAANCGELTLSELRRRELPSSTLQTLVRRELVRIEERPMAFRLGGIEAPVQPLVLNESQLEALASIVSKLGEFHPFLLHGVTGSGKTAVYLKAMQRALDRGQSAILLVPEIGLTPQMVGLLDMAFGQRVALLHSALTPEERTEQWRRIHRGEAPVVVGTRSAIFAPAPNLGLILVDEEHDQSYKQEETPRYNARDVAVMRAKLAGAVVVLGSATPSLESWQNSVQGKYTRIEMNDRVMNRPLPEVELIDMRQRVPADWAGAVVFAVALSSEDTTGAGARREAGDHPAKPARLFLRGDLPRMRKETGVPELARLRSRTTSPTAKSRLHAPASGSNVTTADSSARCRRSVRSATASTSTISARVRSKAKSGWLRSFPGRALGGWIAIRCAAATTSNTCSRACTPARSTCW